MNTSPGGDITTTLVSGFIRPLQSINLPADAGHELYAACETVKDLDQLYFELRIADKTPDDMLHSICDPELPFSNVGASTDMRVNEFEGVGCEISDIDIGDLNDTEFSDIHQLFANHGLLFFRGQSLSEQQHIAFAERWGEININRFFEAHETFPQIAMVRKEPGQKMNIGEGWHTDHSYDLEPALGSILVARELPPCGGDTWFTSMYRALDLLSDGLRATLKELRAVHSAHHIFGSQAAYDTEEDNSGRIVNPGSADSLADPVHPIIIEHPLSGKPALYVNPGFTRHIEGWTREESKPLLNYLYSLAMREELVTKFQWQPGSIAFWDNRATWHRAENDYHGEQRIMHRITLEGGPLGAAV